MMNMLTEEIIGIIASGAVAAILSSFATLAKTRAESKKLIDEANAARIESERAYLETLSSRLRDIQESHSKEMEKLSKQNRDLEDKVSTLNGKLEQLLDWIYGGDLQYKATLESKIHELDPNFPINRPAPPVVSIYNNTATTTPQTP